MDVGERSDLQLLRVSKGAHELKKMIDYCSKSSNSNGKQNYIFNDLLRGAKELQESLLMLSRLQKASSNLSMKKMRPSEREKFAKENSIDLQGRRLSADSSSTNYQQEMKQVIEERFNKFDNEKISSTKNSILSKSKVEFSAQAKKMKAPNLIAKLMGLEDFPLDDHINEAEKEEKVLRRCKSHVVKIKNLDEIIESMRSTGILKSEQSVNLMTNSDLKYEANLSNKDEVPPIVIMKSINLPNREREEINPISETSDLILEDRVLDADFEFSENLEQSEGMSIEKEKIEHPQKLKIAAAASHKQLKRNTAMKEGKRTDDLKKIEINGKKQVEKKKLKATRESMNMNSEESRLTSQTNKSNEQSKKTMKPASFNSLSSIEEEKVSAGRPIRKTDKHGETKSKDEKLNRRTLTESHAISRSKSILAADSLLKRPQKEPTKPFMKGRALNNPISS